MGFAFIREGDTTMHGGRVLTYDPTHTVDGKPLALVGDMAACPRCGGVFPTVKVSKITQTVFSLYSRQRLVKQFAALDPCGVTLA
ncbi:PAAR domain-containing protein [Burkholderia gladioli]|uniref:PAAR domain-containing protein n=1 Tax=Burkholderia gladioli TaxID=28095 RepID=UPI002445C630|nr:PAAR domain-containing protein [Burkholderia gladioli]